MASRFWVPAGGTATGPWDATTTTNWSATSGGAGGASAPTSADNAIFDANSALATGFTVTIGTGAVCADVTASGLTQVMTLAGSAAWSIYGSLSFPAANFTRTYNGTITFAATTTGKTITTNGVSPTSGGVAFVFSGVGGEWTLGSALTLAGGINLSAGTFKTGGFSLTALYLAGNASAIRAFDLGSSVVTLSLATPWIMEPSTNLSINAGTSSLVLTGAVTAMNFGGLALYDVSFTSTARSVDTFTNASSFHNLTMGSLAANGEQVYTTDHDFAVTGTLTLGAANTATKRMQLASSVIGVRHTVTAAAVATLSDVDFRDMAAAGAAGTWSGTRLGDCGNNSNITFAGAANKFWNLVGGGNWSATGWATTSGGSPAANNFPLPQDTVFIQDTGLNASATITMDAGWQIPKLDISARTLAMTYATGTQTPSYYGSVTLSAAVTVTGTGVQNFNGQTTCIVTSGGAAWTQPITINVAGGTVKLGDDWTTGAAVTTTHTSGTFDTNGHTHSTGTYNFSNSNVRALIDSVGLGAGKVVCAATGTSFTAATSTNATTSGPVTISMTNGTSKTFAGGGAALAGLIPSQNGAGAMTITGSSTFTDIKATVFPSTIHFTAGTTQTLLPGATFLSGTLGNLVTIDSTSAGSQFNLSMASGTINSSYLSIKDSNATGGATWNALNSTNVSNNTGWNFLTAAVWSAAGSAALSAVGITAGIAAWAAAGAGALTATGLSSASTVWNAVGSATFAAQGLATSVAALMAAGFGTFNPVGPAAPTPIPIRSRGNVFQTTSLIVDMDIPRAPQGADSANRAPRDRKKDGSYWD